MNNKKATKRALLTSVMALVMCVVMLVGTTFAWFTDTASTAVNKIQAGNLKVDIVAADPDTAGKYDSLDKGTLKFIQAVEGNETKLVENVLWEPGATFFTQGFKIANKGNLALKYKVVVSGITGDTGLLKVMKFDVVSAMEKTGYEANFDTTPGTLTPPTEGASATYSNVYYLRGHMKEEAGNEYKNMTLTGISVTVYATQLASEFDSIDNKYDENADYSADVWDGSTGDLAAATNEGTKTVTIDSGKLLAALAQSVNGGKDYSGYTIKLTKNIDLNGIEWTPIGTATNQFRGTFDGNGKTIGNLKISSGGFIGLFGYVGAGAEVKNVALVGANVSGTERVGALIGKITGNATISGCSTDATSVVAGSDSNTGGLIGEAVTGTITLKDLTNNASVTNTKSGTARAGGIIGQITSSAIVTIDNCQNNGAVSAANGYAGGIVSAYQNGSLTIKNCTNNGTLTGAHKGTLVAWFTTVKQLTIETSGEASGDMIGEIGKDYARHITINNVAYCLNKTNEAFEFSTAFASKQALDTTKVDGILAFLTYAKEKNENFKQDYKNATDRCGVFEYFNAFGGDGWTQLLAKFNTDNGKSMTKDDFTVTWREATMYYYTITD